MTMLVTTVRSAINSLSLVAPPAAGRLAFELWRRPLAVSRVRTAERAIHEAARTGVIDLDGREVVTYAWGDGQRPVLLVHGWRSRASRYVGFVARLLDLGYTPVSYDAPGHGDTPGAVGTIFDHQAIMRGLAEQHGPFEGVIAHSLGVPMALYAVRHGLPANRVVAMSGMSDFGYLVDAFCTELRLRPAVNPALRRAIERTLFDGDAEIWTKFSAADPSGWDGELLIVHDPADDVVSAAQADQLAAGYGDRARRIETAGLGHRQILTDAQVIDDALTFLARTSDEHAAGPR